MCGLCSCVYYKGMPSDWKNQVSEVTDYTQFNGTYVLSDDNESLYECYDYNDLRYLQNTSLYSRYSPSFSWFTSINIDVTDDLVTIKFYSEDKLAHQTQFNKNAFKFKGNALILNMKNQTESGGMVAATVLPTVKIYKGNSNELIVKRKETLLGTIVIIPAVSGQNIWFKLKRKQFEPTSGLYSE